MAAYIVTYDLAQQGQNYSCLYARLRSYPTHWHMQQSVWIVVTPESAVDLRNTLTACLDANDRLFVARLANEAAWRGYAENVSDWIKNQLR